MPHKQMIHKTPRGQQGGDFKINEAHGALNTKSAKKRKSHERRRPQDLEEKSVIRTYLNLNRYLNDYYSFRKTKDPQFSYELWAEELGFRSRGSVRMICRGQRNVSETFLKSFIGREQFSQEDQDYLHLLNYYHQASSTSLKKCLLDKLIEKFEVEHAQKNIRSSIRFLSSIEIPVAQILISFDDFFATEKNLMEALNLNNFEVQSILSVLEDLDLIVWQHSEDPQKCRWVSKNKLFKIPGEISDPAIALFHEQTLREAEIKVREISQYHQFRSLYFSLDEAAFADLCQTLIDMANRLKVKYCNNHISEKRLFKFNFQLYPVTALMSSKDQNPL